MYIIVILFFFCVIQVKRKMFEISGFTLCCYDTIKTGTRGEIKFYRDCMSWPPTKEMVVGALFVLWVVAAIYILYEGLKIHWHFRRVKETWVQQGYVPREGLMLADLEQYPQALGLQTQAEIDHACQVVALHERIPREKHGFHLSWTSAELLVNELKKPAVDALMTAADAKYALDQVDKKYRTQTDREYRRRSFK
jgi:hypothetical protein